MKIKMPKIKEYCEHCKKLITNKMKDNQQVIYASAEHTLSASDSILAFNDPMFGGVYCCRDCYEEEAGIKVAYKKGKQEAQEEEKRFLKKIYDLADDEGLRRDCLIKQRLAELENKK